VPTVYEIPEKDLHPIVLDKLVNGYDPGVLTELAKLIDKIRDFIGDRDDLAGDILRLRGLARLAIEGGGNPVDLKEDMPIWELAENIASQLSQIAAFMPVLDAGFAAVDVLSFLDPEVDDESATGVDDSFDPLPWHLAYE
jgi:hypothetical protein